MKVTVIVNIKGGNLDDMYSIVQRKVNFWLLILELLLNKQFTEKSYHLRSTNENFEKIMTGNFKPIKFEINSNRMTKDFKSLKIKLKIES